MNNADSNCPICHTDPIEFQNVTVVPDPTKRDVILWRQYNCPVCGPFLITSIEAVNMKYKPCDYRLSAWIREHKEFEREPPQITGALLKDVLKNFREHKISEKQLLLLRAIERRTEYAGARVTLSEKDYPLAGAKNHQELAFLCKALAERGLVHFHDSRIATGLVYYVEIRPGGWDYLDKYSVSPAYLDRAFVAMSFDEALDPIYENGIKPAVEKAGYKAHRVDKVPHIDRIDAKIIADIKDSLFMVADVTQQKQGVYFEAGYALALKRPVIWCVGEDDLKKVHFDTRQFYHIVWKTPEDLQERLYDMICAVIGKRG